ncbi:tripartite tricarboxylate transporter substrate binding protein [Bradyrhizobium sp. LHD-71]|uniref:Bug family tripartite tricarboxylate transporter substrate binding protein n=1 Tax=Bradyrhizobium sp. LHD-71 TaxID=3072141 RepID=UPI00280FF741|nr:tripartite tricarboxylate transporter substrate binding protein [Bradyrhizobium sp. LHD-71]MDQ8730000.1 tripartite tricarboxylate transporter substrate binding protein [Bradyrhizobium sp. LHD-71]
MTTWLRRFASAGIALSLVLSGTALAQDYPSRPITLSIPWVAGGPTDIVLRAVAEAAQKHLGQPIIVENRAGGGGSVGPAQMAATAKPDGYTISQMPDAVYRVQLTQKTTYDSQADFTYIVALTGYAYGVTVPTDSPFKSWQDVVAYAKEHPGKLNFGSPGAASTPHMGMERIQKQLGIRLVHVPFKGAAEVNVAVAGGHVMLGASGTSAKSLADAGKLRFLNIWTPHRLKTLPDVPTLRELGIPFEIEGPIGLAGPKGMDPKIVKILHDAFRKTLDDPKVLEVLARMDLVPAYKNGADYKAMLAETMEIERGILTDLGLVKKD